MLALIALRWWIWLIAIASPVIVVLFAFWSFNHYGYEPLTLAQWVFMGVMLFAWASSAAVGVVIAVALILRRWNRGAEAVLGLLVSGTSALLFAGAMLLVYFG